MSEKREVSMRTGRCFFALLLASQLVLMSTASAAAEHYRFGVAPQFEQRKLHATWQPIIDELERRTGLSFQLVSTLTIRDFEREFAGGSFDFVYVNPYHILKTGPANRYFPLVRDSAPLRGILVVRKDSNLQTVAGLDGKVLAFPSPNALGASLLMRADLERLYHVRFTPLYVKTHSSVYLHVVQGLTAAGGGVEKTLREQDPAIRDALRILYTTRDMPSHPVAVHQRVPQEVREKVKRALLDMGGAPEGSALLSRVPIRQVVAATLDDYRTMLDWGLEAYWDASWKEE